MSPELETLDQLLGGDLSLEIVRGLFPDAERFSSAVIVMLDAGDVNLLDSEGRFVPPWLRMAILARPAGHPQLRSHRLSITDAGAARMG